MWIYPVLTISHFRHVILQVVGTYWILFGIVNGLLEVRSEPAEDITQTFPIGLEVSIVNCCLAGVSRILVPKNSYTLVISLLAVVCRVWIIAPAICWRWQLANVSEELVK